MRKPYYLLVWLVALVFGMSFAVPAEDIPDTPYDESELMPYESVPQLSALPAALARSLPVVPVRQSDSRRALKKLVRAAHPVSESIIILVHSLRC